MIPLMLTVFLVQLAIYVVNTIGAKAITELCWQFSAQLPLSSTKDAKEQIRLRREVVRLKREMAAISAQDDFAKWAKLRREHDKVLAAHDKKGTEVSAHRSSFDLKVNAARWTLTSGVRMFLQFWHSRTPIYTYPRGWFPWPVEWLLAFPRCPRGGVSINVWSMACATVISLLGDLIFYIYGQIQPAQGSKEKQKMGVEADKRK